MFQTDSNLKHIKIVQIAFVVMSLQEFFIFYLTQLPTFTILTI